jgi:hypothetical protein
MAGTADPRAVLLDVPVMLLELMRDGASILVFPGGAREAFERRGERYRLIWDGRTGFARLAIGTAVVRRLLAA